MSTIAHIAVSISNIDRSLAFYRKYFGFRRIEEFKISPGDFRICILRKDKITLELFEFKHRRSLPAYRKQLSSDLKTIGVKHFAFAERNITAAYNRFKKAKVKLATNIRVFEDGLRYFFIKDPDGILIEIMEAE